MTPGSCQKIVNALIQARTVDEISEVFSDICTYLELEHSGRIPVSLLRPRLGSSDICCEEWIGHSPGPSRAALIPLIRLCRRKMRLIHRERLVSGIEEVHPVRQLVDETREVGFGGRSRQQVSDRSGAEAASFWAVSAEKREKANKWNLATLSLVLLFYAYLLEENRRAVIRDPIEANKTELTDREKECLFWAAEGKTSWETAKILQISKRTVIFHLQNATRKLNAVNRQNAIARAVVLGLVSPKIN